MNKDLTVGKPEAVLWKFCLPLFGSIVFQQLYNIADSLVAGKFVGEEALAAVGNSYEVTLILIAVAFGCNIGCSVVVSKLFGRKDERGLKTAISTALIVSGVLCVIFMAAGLLFCTPLLRLIQTPENIFADSKLYLDIYLWGLPFLFFYQIINGFFTALGDSKTPFFFLAVSSVANIAVDVLFVTAFSMGVAGVAWATFLCQGISCILSFFFLFARLRGFQTEKAPLFSKKLLFEIMRIAVPSILQQSFISVGNIVIQGAINSFGSGVIAGYSASVKLNNLVITSFTTLANGISNYTAQNLGANKPERVKSGFFAGIRLVWIICIPFVICYFLLGKYLVLLFMNEPTDIALQTGITFLRILSPFYFVISAKLVADGILRGAGKMGAFMIATFIDLILRVALALILSRYFGETGIWAAWPVGWCVSTVMSMLFYRKGAWRKTA